jgi:MoaA/NifB/PqqE/SkfB family radical SAM enzyme
MFSLGLEPTNMCNLSCLHCLRDKLEPRESISLELVNKILKEAKALKIGKIKLTGGELATYPYLEELIPMIVDNGFHFNFVTNGFRFRDRMLPLLAEIKVKKKLDEVCFSLDGAKAKSHDALRGEGSFKEMLEVATLCRFKDIPLSLKSVITQYNKHELTELALLGATLGAQNHSFILPLPTPELIKNNIIPSPSELEEIMLWILNSLSPSLKSNVNVDAYCLPTVVFWCHSFRCPTVDYQGNLIFCCSMSHFTDEDKPALSGQELLVNLEKKSLSEGISRHFDQLAKLMKERLEDAKGLSSLTYIPCYYCLKYFGKLSWLKNYPDSPWAAGILEDES